MEKATLGVRTRHCCPRCEVSGQVSPPGRPLPFPQGCQGWVAVQRPSGEGTVCPTSGTGRVWPIALSLTPRGEGRLPGASGPPQLHLGEWRSIAAPSPEDLRGT